MKSDDKVNRRLIVEAAEAGQAKWRPEAFRMSADGRTAVAADIAKGIAKRAQRGDAAAIAFKETDAFRPFLPPPAAIGLPGKMAVIVCHFNPCGYQRRVELFRQFHAASVSQGADVWIVEGAIDGKYELGAFSNCQRVRLKSWLWHKERLLNMRIKSLPPEYDKVAWVDGDILFDNPDWISDASSALESHPVIQPFSEALWLSSSGVPCQWWGDGSSVVRPSVGFASTENPGVQGIDRMVPGLAWAARRSFIESVSLFEHPLFCADSIMALGFLGRFDESNDYLTLGSKEIGRLASEWSRLVSPKVGRSVGYSTGLVRHLWHGKMLDRQYTNPLFRDRFRSFDPAVHLTESKSGAMEWRDDAPAKMIETVRGYFKGRRDDE